MNRIFTFLAAFLFSISNLRGQLDLHSFQWRFEAKDSAAMRNFDVLPLPDNGFVFSGLLEKPAGSNLFFPSIWRVDCQGEVVWAKVFNVATESANNTYGRVLGLPSGDFILVSNVGFFFTTPRNDIFVARVDGEGNAVWAKRIGGGTNQQDLAQGATMTADGNFVLAGKTASHGPDANSNNNYTDQYFLKMNPDGAILWSRTVGNAGAIDRSFDITELPDGSLVSAGSYLQNGTFFANLLKMDATGNFIWNKGFGESVAPHGSHAYGVLACSDGGFLVTGSTTILQSDFTGWPDFLIVKTGADGVAHWSRVIAGGAPDIFENASNAVELPNGDFAVMCATNSYQTIGFVGNKYAVITLSPDGGLQKVQTYNLGSSHYPRILPNPIEGGWLINGFTNWTEYGGNGNRFDPILINTDAFLEVNGCFTNDFTAVTSEFDPAFELPDLPSTEASGGSVVSSLVNSSSFEMLFKPVCETNGFSECATAIFEKRSVENGFSIFPNPALARQAVSLNWEENGVEEIVVFDMRGRLIQIYSPTPGLKNIDIRSETAGIFWVKLQGRGLNRVEKLVVH